jgi:hypothetical protein
MTLNIDLQPEIERSLSARAQEKGISLSEFAREVLTVAAMPHRGIEERSKAENLYELFAPVRGLLTDEEVDRYFGRTASQSRPLELE